MSFQEVRMRCDGCGLPHGELTPFSGATGDGDQHVLLWLCDGCSAAYAGEGEQGDRRADD